MSLKTFLAITLYTIIAATLEFFFPNYGIIFCLLIMILLMMQPRTQSPSMNSNIIEKKAVGFLLQKANDSLNKANQIFEGFEPSKEFEVK